MEIEQQHFPIFKAKREKAEDEGKLRPAVECDEFILSFELGHLDSDDEANKPDL